MSVLHLRYNVNDTAVQSFQYGSDSNGNVCSVVNISSYPLYDDNNVVIGNVQFIDNGVVPVSTNNFQNAPEQLYNEVGTFFVGQLGTIVYNYSFISDDAFFSSGKLFITVASASGIYYDRVDKIVVDVDSDYGWRDVWISLL
jgi:hypothetical protein